MDEDITTAVGKVIRIADERLQDRLAEIMRGSVEETQNAFLDAEADQACNTGRYECTNARRDSRAGPCGRTLHTRAGEMKLKISNLRRQMFATAIIEGYRRREVSVEEALIEMCLAGVSVRRIETSPKPYGGCG